MRRRDVIYLSLLAAILSFTVVLTVHVFTLQHDLKDNIQSQVPNRVSNVAHWCTAINEGRVYARARANAQHTRDPAHFPQYTLPLLDCKQLEAKTAASAH